MTKSNLPVLASEDGFHKYLREINNIPSLTPEEEYMLAKSFLEREDLEAAHQLTKSHLKLVAKIALTYRNYGLPVTDLVAEGNIGLMHAVKKYDPDLGHRLSTYAMWWIKAHIQDYILKSWSLVKIGTTAAQKKLFFSLNKVKNKLRALHARDVNSDDYKEISEELGVSEQEVASMDARLSGGDVSLNNIISDDGDTEIVDLLEDESASHELVLANNQDMEIKRQILTSAMESLKEREASIFYARKLQEPPSTLDDLSCKYDISKERVRQIENRAFEKVQQFMLEHVAKDVTA